jgi:hypothetical protein
MGERYVKACAYVSVYSQTHTRKSSRARANVVYETNIDRERPALRRSRVCRDEPVAGGVGEGRV